MSQYNVSEVPRLVAARDAARLHANGVHSTEDVLQKGARADGRRALAKTTGVRLATVETLARRADLLRLSDIGPEHVLLLEAAGVKSVPDLATRDAAALGATLGAAGKAKHLPA